MNNNSGFSESLWMQVQLPTFSALDQNLNVDVCIVGGGIVGLMSAYTLVKNGKSVAIVDQGIIAGGQSARTTGHLTWVLDDRFQDLEKLFGENGAKLAAISHAAAIDYIEKIIEDENIECDFERVDAYLFVPPEDSMDVLDKEFDAIKKTGMPVQRAPRAPFSNSFDTGPCLKFSGQAQFHILKFLQGLCKAIEKHGGKIYSDTQVDQFTDGSPCTVTMQSGKKITAQSVIAAICTPSNNRFYIHTKQSAYRTYVIGATVPKDAVPKALYWDTADPYHYIRVQKHLSDPKLDWVLIGGEDHRTGQDPDIDAKYDQLEKWARQRIPQLGKIEYRWSGQIFEPMDSLAFIGKNPGDKNIYIATGDSGNGLTHAAIAAILLPDLILGQDNPWKELYEPSRITLKAAADFIENNVNVVLQYRDWLTPGDVQQIEELAPDEGFILRKGVKKLAVYKDKDNKIHFNDAFCPHLGGLVRWNPGEKSWDCPCHGSRFSGTGKVMNGPSLQDLENIKD